MQNSQDKRQKHPYWFQVGQHHAGFNSPTALSRRYLAAATPRVFTIPLRVSCNAHSALLRPASGRNGGVS